MAVVQLKLNEYEKTVAESEKPVLIDFYADWCGPCRMLAPVLEAAESEYGDRVLFCRANVDEESELASRFRVSVIPTLVFMEGGEISGVKEGYLSPEELRSFLKL